MKIYEGLDTYHTLFQRAVTWVSYDLGGFQYVGEGSVSMLASQRRGGGQFPAFPTERLGMLGEHKQWPLSAVLQLPNLLLKVQSSLSTMLEK